jgi:hypothetical protein
MGSRWTGDSKPTLGRDASSPNALGIVRNLPSGVAGTALHPPIAVPFDGLQSEPEHGGIGLAVELALRRTAWPIFSGSFRTRSSTIGSC